MAELAETIVAVRADGKSRKTYCPAHDDRQASLSVSLGDRGGMLLNCHAGCAFTDIVAAAKLTAADYGPPRASAPPKKIIIATYPYRDEAGLLLYEAVRYAPKAFSQRRPKTGGGWNWNMTGVRRVIYKLPELVAHLAGDGRGDVFICEGEKDVERLWRAGLPSTTNVGGAGKNKWQADYTQQLVAVGARSVIVLPDNDAAGRAHADQIAMSCRAAGLPVQIVSLPDLPEKGDVSDWLDDPAHPHTADELVTVVMDECAYAAAAHADAAAAASDLATLLKQVQAFLQQFVVLTSDQAIATALWVAHAHAFAAFDCTGYLHVTSVTKRSGKTRLLEVLELLVPRPWLTGRTSAAALVRKVDAVAPTLLLDETDAAFNGDPEYSEALRGILNSGFRRSGRTTLCVGQGASLTTQEFVTYNPKAIAGIGALPGTVADRAIPIELKRKTGNEVVQRFRERDAKAAATPLRDALAAWAGTALDRLRSARPALPAALHDRAQDIVEPLIAIADEAGGSWPDAASRAVVALLAEAGEDDLTLDLLHDIQDVFTDDDKITFFSSSALVAKLVALDDRPWATFHKGKAISPHRVAKFLKPFGIIPTSNGSARGYAKDRFVDAWARYPRPKVSNRQSPNKDGPEPAFSKCQTPSTIDTSKTEKSSMNTGLIDGLTLTHPERAAETDEVGAGDDDPDVF